MYVSTGVIKFSRAFKCMPRASHARTQAQNEARRLTDPPWGPDAHGLPLEPSPTKGSSSRLSGPSFEGSLQTEPENPASSLSDYQRSCRETMRRKAADWVSQEWGMMRRSCLEKPLRVKAPRIEMGNPASRKPFAV